MEHQMKAALMRIILAIPVLGWSLRDVRDGGSASLGWAVFNLFAVSILAFVLFGWAAVSVIALIASVAVLLTFFVNL